MNALEQAQLTITRVLSKYLAGDTLGRDDEKALNAAVRSLEALAKLSPRLAAEDGPSPVPEPLAS